MALRLLVTGDPILDVWSYGIRDEDKRWVPELTITTPGGAANTLANAAAIGKGLVHVWNELPQKHYELIRLVNQYASGGGLDTQYWNYHHRELHKMYRLCSTALNPSWGRHRETFALIASEYNKGTLSRPTKRNIPPMEFAVVDSRYRTLDMSWLRTAKVKIWHATGDEFDDEWSSNFDFVVHTNGPGEVTVITGNHPDPRADTLPVPDTRVVDTIGAGDTLTAAIGIYLAHEIKQGNSIDFKEVYEATRFAIWCCQDVVTKHLTAICTRTLEEYLNVHN